MARRINAKLVPGLLCKGTTGREIYRTRRIAQQSVKKVREAASKMLCVKCSKAPTSVCAN